jgi:hypothetical protein
MQQLYRGSRAHLAYIPRRTAGEYLTLIDPLLVVLAFVRMLVRGR